MVHRPEIKFCLGIQDSHKSFFLKFQSEEQIKKWMTQIKTTKVALWKKEAEEGTTLTTKSPAVNVVTNTPTKVARKFFTHAASHRSADFNHNSNNSNTNIEEPVSPPVDIYNDISAIGYLLKYNIPVGVNYDKNNLNLQNYPAIRYLFLLRGKTLYYYLSEYYEDLVGLLEIGDAMIRINESADAFQFEVIGKRETFFLEACDNIDLRSWHLALHTARVQQQKIATQRESVTAPNPLHQTSQTQQQQQQQQQNSNISSESSIIVQHKGILTIIGRNELNYLYYLNGPNLSWYLPEDEELSTKIGSINIENSTFCDFFDPEITNQQEQSGFQICNPNSKDLVLVAESADEKRNWLNQLKKAKLQYWQSPINTDTFDNRGFLWKIVGKKKLRRWFVLNDLYLLFFKSPKDHSPEGEICLQFARISPVICKETNFRFELQTDKINVLLDASNSSNRDRWLTALKNTKFRHKKKNLSSDFSNSNEVKKKNLFI